MSVTVVCFLTPNSPGTEGEDKEVREEETIFSGFW